MESRPCEIQAQAAARQADRAWRKRPRRIKGLCDGLTDGADEPKLDLDPAGGSEGESESSSDSSDSESDTDCFESCDPPSPDSGEDSEPSGAGAEESLQQKPDQRARGCPSLSHPRPSLRTPAIPSPTRANPIRSTWNRGGEAR